MTHPAPRRHGVSLRSEPHDGSVVPDSGGSFACTATTTKSTSLPRARFARCSGEATTITGLAALAVWLLAAATQLWSSRWWPRKGAEPSLSFALVETGRGTGRTGRAGDVRDPYRLPDNPRRAGRPAEHRRGASARGRTRPHERRVRVGSAQALGDWRPMSAKKAPNEAGDEIETSETQRGRDRSARACASASSRT